MNSTGGMVVGNALKVVNGSLHHPSASIVMMKNLTKLVSYISVSYLISIYVERPNQMMATPPNIINKANDFKTI